jgi:tRNA U34 5-methylaminomethyl-2-thiouridine-forming methyltransferase MnmC
LKKLKKSEKFINFKKIITADGSPTLYSINVNEYYKSKHGALTESNYVFVNNGLEFWKKKNNKSKCRIFEMGFGLGYNAYSTLVSKSINNMKIEYNTIDAFPVEFGVIESLNFDNYIQNKTYYKLFLKLHSTPWGLKFDFNSSFSFLKIKSKIENYNFKNKYDVIFYDPFGYRVQPQLWSNNILLPLLNSLNPNGVFVTYSSKGSVKRIIESSGLSIEKLNGPPGKREMLRGYKGNREIF